VTTPPPFRKNSTGQAFNNVIYTDTKLREVAVAVVRGNIAAAAAATNGNVKQPSPPPHSGQQQEQNEASLAQQLHLLPRSSSHESNLKDISSIVSNATRTSYQQQQSEPNGGSGRHMLPVATMKVNNSSSESFSYLLLSQQKQQLLLNEQRRLSTEGSDYSGSRCASGQTSPRNGSSPTRANSGSIESNKYSNRSDLNQLSQLAADLDYFKCKLLILIYSYSF
jgi:hypothetical protein